MAVRRTVAKPVVDSDLFLDMPLSAQALYFHLVVRSNGNGFVNNAKSVCRAVGASDGDIVILKENNFIADGLLVPKGSISILEWKQHRGDTE